MDKDVSGLLRTGPFHDTLRAAIRARGLTLDRVCSRLAARGLPVGLSTLSGWQHGHTRPSSPDAVLALEEILGLPRRALSDLIPRTDLSEAVGPLGQLLGEIPGARERTLDLISQHDTVTVDAAGLATQVTSRIVVRARRDDVDRYLMRYFGDSGADTSRVVVEPLQNCRLGSVHLHPHAPVLVAELLFDQRLREGDTWVFDRRITNSPGARSVEHALSVRHRVEHYLLQIRFDPGLRPVDCHAFTRTDLYEPRRRVADLPLSAHHAVHFFAAPLITGVHGIQWTWP